MEIKHLDTANEFIKQLDLPKVKNKNRVNANISETFNDGSGAFKIIDSGLAVVKTRGDHTVIYRSKIQLPIQSEDLTQIISQLYNKFDYLKHEVNITHVYYSGILLPGLPEQYATLSPDSHGPTDKIEIRFYAKYDTE